MRKKKSKKGMKNSASKTKVVKERRENRGIKRKWRRKTTTERQLVGK